MTQPSRPAIARAPAPAVPERGCRAPLVGAALALLFCASPAAAWQDMTVGEEIANTRTALESWVEVRRTISKEKRDWAVGKEMLTDRLAVVERETDALRERIAETKENIAETERKRAELEAENAALEEVASSLERTVTQLEARASALLVQLPDPIRDRVKTLSQQFPEDPADTELSLSARFQNVVGVLNEVNKFHRDITVTSEVRELADGTTAEVTALYVGIGEGYYVSGDGRAAGMGRGTPEGWVWEPANDAAPQIARAIAILQNEEIAAFVQLPLHID